VLPAAVRPQIGLAYLLARTTDTIADTNSSRGGNGSTRCKNSASGFSAQNSAPLNFRRTPKHQGSPAEKLC